MIEYQHQWETVETFDFSSLITQEDQTLAVKDIEEIIASGNWFKTSPKYQTQENLFYRQSEHWLKIKHSFIFSCFMYLKKEVKINNIQSWSFMTSNQTVEKYLSARRNGFGFQNGYLEHRSFETCHSRNLWHRIWPNDHKSLSRQTGP